MKALDLLGVGLAVAGALAYMVVRLRRTLGGRRKARGGPGTGGHGGAESGCAGCPLSKGGSGKGGGCPGCG